MLQNGYGHSTWSPTHPPHCRGITSGSPQQVHWPGMGHFGAQLHMGLAAWQMPVQEAWGPGHTGCGHQDRAEQTAAESGHSPDLGLRRLLQSRPAWEPLREVFVHWKRCYSVASVFPTRGTFVKLAENNLYRVHVTEANSMKLWFLMNRPAGKIE